MEGSRTSQAKVQEPQSDSTIQHISVDEQESSNTVVTSSEPQTPVKSKPSSNALVPMTWPKVHMYEMGYHKCENQFILYVY